MHIGFLLPNVRKINWLEYPSSLFSRGVLLRAPLFLFATKPAVHNERREKKYGGRTGNCTESSGANQCPTHMYLRVHRTATTKEGVTPWPCVRAYKLELQQRQSHICVCTWNMYERLAAWDLSTYGKGCKVKVGSSDEGTDVRRGVISLSSSFCWSQFFF